MQRNRLQLVHGDKLMPGLSHLFSDGVHPTEEGFGHYESGISDEHDGKMGSKLL
ncbi:hypothetical protein LJR153_002334 [Paenibacillus sp. LjRoot153]|uniref:hypothetical protein n=1 Tax=Paenibacillus sp. LjRoot153 TaxID=3342270 RepID=UPI003ECE56CE